MWLFFFVVTHYLFYAWNNLFTIDLRKTRPLVVNDFRTDKNLAWAGTCTRPAVKRHCWALLWVIMFPFCTQIITSDIHITPYSQDCKSIYSLEYTYISKVLLCHFTDNDANTPTKVIINTAAVSKTVEISNAFVATIWTKAIIVTVCSEIIHVTMCSALAFA
jgi:hypothetical protein